MPSDRLVIILTPLFTAEESRMRTCDTLEMKDPSRDAAMEAKADSAADGPRAASDPNAENQREHQDRAGGGEHRRGERREV